MEIYELDRSNITKQAQSIIRKIKRSSSTEDKANAGLALAILAVSQSTKEDSVANQLLNLLKDLKL